jgi:tetratricopeptide (TPR) repeat protein
MGGRPRQVEALQPRLNKVGKGQNMKGERRHELERNELADWLAKVFEVIKPFQYAILGAVLLVAVVAVLYTFWIGRASGEQVAAWDVFHRAVWDLSQGNPSPTDFEAIVDEAIVDDYPDTDVALWARVMAADLHLAIGCDRLFHDKGLANQELREAVDHYLAILGSDRSSAELRRRATFGLARAYESQGNLEKAKEHYEEVGKRGAYAAAATSRLEDLKRPATKQLYDRFAKFDPQPVSPVGFGQPGERPIFDLDSLKEGESLFDPKFLELDENGAEEDQPKDLSDTPAEPAESQPDATDTDATDTEASDTEASDTEPTIPEETDPDDSVEPSVEKSE